MENVCVYGSRLEHMESAVWYGEPPVCIVIRLKIRKKRSRQPEYAFRPIPDPCPQIHLEEDG